jgi:hypothetical protein
MSSRWSRGRIRGSSRRWFALAAVVVALAVAGAVLALVVRSGTPSATKVASSSAAITGSIPLASGDDLVRSLPPPRASGRILVATAACRLEVVDVATRAITRPRPDVSSCAATFLPAPGFAIASVAAGPTPPVWRRLGRTPAADRTLPMEVPATWAVGPGGDVAFCQPPRPVVLFPARGPGRSLPGCSPAWWGGRLVRIDPGGRIVDEHGTAVVDASGAGDIVAGDGALAASRDGSHLALVHGTAPNIVVSVFDPAGRPTSTTPLPKIGDVVAVRLSNDGQLVAIETNAGWRIARTDGSVTPIDDVAQSEIIDVALSPDNRSVAVALARRIVFLDPETLGPVAQLPVRAAALDWAP